jgi:UDP-3-O-[3-hydroxymyristoyl] glucosamine N-acyltransferase
MKFNNRNVFISPKAQIGLNVKIGDNSTIYENVVVGDNTIIANDCVIGEPTAAYYKNIETYVNPPTFIGPGSLLRSHNIIYAGSSFGENLNTGHRVTIREGTKVGKNCLISTLADIQGNCKIGDYSRIYSNVHIGELTDIGNFVFIFPFTIFTNDPQPPSNNLMGSKVGDYSIITVHCSVLPGVSIGKNCLIGANSVVSRNIDDFTFALGSPAKKILNLPEIDSKEFPSKKHYPWPYSFERGMPWQGVGFDEWLKKQSTYND